MNYIKHLTGFFEKVVFDHNLNPTHISLYIALFQYWNLNRFINPVSITRDEVMRVSKICSRATYHKCMRELHEKGYLKYEPSFNPFRGSQVYLVDLSETVKPKQKRVPLAVKNGEPNEQPNEIAVNKQQTSSLPAAELPLVSSINNINSTNNINVLNEEKSKKNNSKKNLIKKFREPSSAEVGLFFKEQKCKSEDAERFYNYYSSNGWLVGGKTRMKNWEAAARNWILNADKFQSKDNTKLLKPNNLHVKTDKNYGEPL